MISDFCGFVKKEKLLINDLIFSREGLQEYVTHLEKKKTENVATHLTKEVFIKFLLCDGKHDSPECKLFKEKYLQERIIFLFEQILCYGCFCPVSASHNTRNCKNVRKWKNVKSENKDTRILCMIIQLKNLKKNLQRVVRKRKMSKRIFTATVNMSSEVISICMVSVMVRHNLSSRIVKKYSLLGTSSPATFAKENWLRNLNIQGRKRQLPNHE